MSHLPHSTLIESLKIYKASSILKSGLSSPFILKAHMRTSHTRYNEQA